MPQSQPVTLPLSKSFYVRCENGFLLLEVAHHSVT